MITMYEAYFVFPIFAIIKVHLSSSTYSSVRVEHSSISQCMINTDQHEANKVDPGFKADVKEVRSLALR